MSHPRRLDYPEIPVRISNLTTSDALDMTDILHHNWPLLHLKTPPLKCFCTQQSPFFVPLTPKTAINDSILQSFKWHIWTCLAFHDFKLRSSTNCSDACVTYETNATRQNMQFTTSCILHDTYINTNWLLQGFVMQKKIRSKENSSAYFRALNPAHQIFTGAVQVMFCIQKPICFNNSWNCLDWLLNPQPDLSSILW